MESRRVLTSIGAGVATFLLVAVLVIEFLDFEFSSIVGLPVGVVAGLAVGVGLWVRIAGFRPAVRRVASAYASFGIAILLLLVLRYINIGRDVLSVDVIAGLGFVTAVAVYGSLWLLDRESG